MKRLDHFLRLDDQHHEDDWLIRARLLVSVTISMALMLILALAAQPWLRLPILSPWNGVCAVMFLAAPFVLRATGSLAAAAHLAILGAVSLITWYSVELGGVSSTAFIWFAIVPVFGFLVVGRRFGLIWCAISLGLASLIACLHAVGYTNELALSSHARATQSALNFFCLFLCLLCIGMMFESFKNQTIGRLHETLADLEASRQLAEEATLAKSQFLANMSHEIRTPMNGVLGTTELLLRSELSEAQQQLAQASFRSAKGLLVILNDVLDFSKIEAGAVRLEPKPTEIRPLLADITTLFAPEAEARGLQLLGEVGSEVPTWLEVDGARLTQVLTNLVANALRFTEEGTIRVGLSWYEQGDGSGELHGEVVDSGIGIARQSQVGLFQPFTQADDSDSRRFGGTGLGLAISREVVESMGGTIGVASETGRGSRFFFHVLSRAAEPTGRDAGPIVSRPTSSGTEAPRVLVAEDQPVNQEVARAFLEAAGFEVLVVPDGRRAVEAVSSSSPSLVLMDCQMPFLDGYAATSELRRRGFRGAIIGVTASAMASDRERCLESGMDDYLAKPFSGDALIEMVLRWTGVSDANPEPSSPRTGGDRGVGDGLDEAALEQIRQLDPEGRGGLVSRVIGSFVESLEAEVRIIRMAVDGGAVDDVGRAAHKLKSASAAVGALRVAQVATALEAAAQEEDLREVERLAAELADAAERVRPVMLEMLESSASPGSA